MTTPVRFTGLNYGLNALSTSGGGLFNNLSNAPTVEANPDGTGGYAIYFRPNVGGMVDASWTLATPSTVVGTAYVYYHSWPSMDNEIFWVTLTAGVTTGIKLRASDKKLFVRWWSTADGNAANVTLQLDTWYRVDFKIDLTANPNKVDFQVAVGHGSATAATQSTLAQAATTATAIYLGYSNSTDTGIQLYERNIFVSTTPTDYPIGPLVVEGLRPFGDGTHNNAANIMEDSAGNDIDGVTYKAFTYLDENPWVSDAGVDYVRQTGDGTGNWCRINFTGTSQTQILGVMGLLQYSSASATANRGACVFVDEDGVTTTLYGASGSTADYSESSSFYKSVILRTPTGGWDQAAVNAISCLFGYSGDANPDPYWQAIMLEVAYVPSAGGVYSLTVDMGAYSQTGVSASLKADRTIPVNIGSYNYSGVSANLFRGFNISAGVGSYSLSGIATNLLVTRSLSANVGSYSINGVDALLKAGRILYPDVGSYSFSGVDVFFRADRKIIVDVGSYLLSGQVSGLLADRKLAVDVGAYSLLGTAANLLSGRGILIDAGSYVLSGTPSDLRADRKIVSDVGSYSISGIVASLLAGKAIFPDVGQYDLLGINATLSKSGLNFYTLSVDPGAYALSGVDAAFKLGRIFIVDSGNYSISGVNVLLKADRLIAPAVGSYALSGVTANLRADRKLISDIGSYAIGGISSSLLWNRALIPSIGSYLLSGVDANLVHSGGLVHYIITAENGIYVLSGISVGLLYIPLTAIISANRVFSVNLENRIGAVPIEDRKSSVIIDSRTYPTEVDDRIFSVQSGVREYEVV